jgi:hypothetical protein
MHRFITFACAVTAATLLVVGCGSDSDDSSSGGGGSGGSGGSGGGSSNAQCVGVYADLTQAMFTSKLATAGKCIGDSDATAVCTKDVTKTTAQCGASCYATAEKTDAAQDACTSSCISDMITLTSDCLGCYLTDVACSRKHCLLMCGTAPTSAGCATCRQENGCADTFYSCSGLPLPSGSGASGGSGGGTSTGAAGDTSTSAGAGG